MTATRTIPICPHNIPVNSVCYTGTHDNDTTLGFMKSLPGDEFVRVKARLRAGDAAGGGRRPHLRSGERGEGAVFPLLGERGKSRRRARAGSFAARGGGPHEYARRRGGELAFPPAAGSAVIPCAASSCRAGRRGACMMQKGQNYLYKKREYFCGSPVFM